MRENIEYRAWADGKMRYPNKSREDWWFFGSEGYWSLNDGLVIETIICDSLESKDTHLMQYIGIKDVNGVKIFEGDIVNHKMPNTIRFIGEVIVGVIEYIPCLASFKTVNEDGAEEPLHDDIRLEVIGNIYEI